MTEPYFPAFPDSPAADPWPVWVDGRAGHKAKCYVWKPQDSARAGSVCLGVCRPGRHRAHVTVQLTVSQARDFADALLNAADELEQHEQERGA